MGLFGFLYVSRFEKKEIMNDLAKVWVYQSSRRFTDAEVTELTLGLRDFTASWQAHGADLIADFQLIENQFIVFLVDETNHSASGCSIDSSVGFIKETEQKFQVNLTDKGLVGFWADDKIEIIPFNKVKSTIESGKITQQTIIFNNSVATFKEFKSDWQIPASDSWMKRFFV